jgi:hypothetical protein
VPVANAKQKTAMSDVVGAPSRVCRRRSSVIGASREFGIAVRTAGTGRSMRHRIASPLDHERLTQTHQRQTMDRPVA